jgi:hypothetical protein
VAIIIWLATVYSRACDGVADEAGRFALPASRERYPARVNAIGMSEDKCVFMTHLVSERTKTLPIHDRDLCIRNRVSERELFASHGRVS